MELGISGLLSVLMNLASIIKVTKHHLIQLISLIKYAN